MTILGNLETSTTTRVSAGSLADVLSFLITTTGVCGFARRRPLPPQHDNGCLRVLPQTSVDGRLRVRNHNDGVRGCSRRRRHPLQSQRVSVGSPTDVLFATKSPQDQHEHQRRHVNWDTADIGVLQTSDLDQVSKQRVLCLLLIPTHTPEIK